MVLKRECLEINTENSIEQTKAERQVDETGSSEIKKDEVKGPEPVLLNYFNL